LIAIRRSVAALLVILAACTGEGGGARQASPPSTPSPARLTTSRLPRVVLRADPTVRATRWHRVTTIRFGDGESEVGFVPVSRDVTPVPYLPPSFAVAPNGSIWILDEVKKRAAHYSVSGRYLGSVGGLSFDRYHAHPRDMAMVGDRPFVLEQHVDTNVGLVAAPNADGRFARTSVRVGGRPAVVSLLVPNSGSSTGMVSGRAIHIPDPLISVPRGVFDLDVPGTGDAERIPGIPSGDGTFVSGFDNETQDFEFQFIRGAERSVLPVRFGMLTRGHHVHAVVGFHAEGATDHGFIAWVMVAPESVKASRIYGGGQWLFGVFDDGSPLLWERLPESRFDEFLVRKLTVGPDDSIYMMQVDRKGVSIFRR
jgi:hypothetical protein